MGEIMNRADLKQAKTLDELIDILESRGLVIGDRDNARSQLSMIGYYRLSGYSLGLRNNDVFRPNVSLDEIVEIYKFDGQLRKMMYGVIEPIEIQMRALVANTLALKYGNIAHRDPSLCIDPISHQKFIEIYKKSLVEMSRVAFVDHGLKQYGELPIWVAVETWPFGTLSKFYGNMLLDDQKVVADSFDVNETYLPGWLECLAYIRNICAHNGRLYNRVITKLPKLYSEDKKYYGIKLFPVLIVIKKMYRGKGAWLDFSKELSAAISSHSEIKLAFMGFPENWKEALEIEECPKVEPFEKTEE